MLLTDHGIKQTLHPSQEYGAGPNILGGHGMQRRSERKKHTQWTNPLPTGRKKRVQGPYRLPTGEMQLRLPPVRCNCVGSGHRWDEPPPLGSVPFVVAVEVEEGEMVVGEDWAPLITLVTGSRMEEIGATNRERKSSYRKSWSRKARQYTNWAISMRTTT
jgi:hypothetical protein